MHFVHVEDFIHPDAGYQLNLLSRLQVQQGHDVTIVTSELHKIPKWVTSFFGNENIEEKDKNNLKNTGVRIIRVPLIGFYSGRSIFSLKIFKVVDNLKPDVLFLHGEVSLTTIRFINQSSLRKYPMVIDSHMLEMASVNKFSKLFNFFYKIFVTTKILRREIPLIRIVDSNFVEKHLGYPLNKTILLSMGTDTNFFKPDKEANFQFRLKYNIKKDDFVIVYAGKLDVYKGGQFLAESVKEKIISSNNRNIVFLIIGNAPGEYGQKVESILLSSKNRILRFPTQSYSDLATFYQAADLSIFPKQCSMSFFEVQSCGVPVLFEDNEINNSRAQFGNAFIFAPQNIEEFRSNIIKCAEIDSIQYQIIRDNSRNYILNNFDFVPIAQKFTDVMIKEYSRFHKLN